MAVDDDILLKNPFGFQLVGVIVNTEQIRQAITKDQMNKFLKFVREDNVYCKYYEVFYILFHTGMRISEFCGLTINDIDMENRIIDINHQLQRTSDMRYLIESTKTNAGTRKLPMTDDVYQMFKTILESRPDNLPEIMIDGYCGFLFRDKNGMPEVAMHWEHRFKNAVTRYNEIFKLQMPSITPHVCRHTYCSNMARAKMNSKTLQYLMGHSDISVTINISYGHTCQSSYISILNALPLDYAECHKEIFKTTLRTNTPRSKITTARQFVISQVVGLFRTLKQFIQ